VGAPMTVKLKWVLFLHKTGFVCLRG